MTPSAQTAAPRQYFGDAAIAALPGPGLPHDRHARIAARRSFVDLKHQFQLAIAALDGMRGDWLRHQVRQTQEPGDLWLLRGAVFAALDALGDHGQRARADLYRMLDGVFPGGGALLPYGARP